MNISPSSFRIVERIRARNHLETHITDAMRLCAQGQQELLRALQSLALAEGFTADEEFRSAPDELSVLS